LRRYAKNFSSAVKGNTPTPIILPENAEERKPGGTHNLRRKLLP
jgi:hypothetical protein